MAKKQPDPGGGRPPDKHMRLRADLAERLEILARRNTTNATLELRRAVIAHLIAADPPLWPPDQDCAPAEDPGPNDGD